MPTTGSTSDVSPPTSRPATRPTTGWLLRRDETGSLLLLVLVYALIAGVLVVVATDASRLFLARRGLSAVADGAALAAAQGADRDAVYRGHGGDAVPLSTDAVRQAVSRYLEVAGAAGEYPGLRLVATEVSPDRRTVAVVLAQPVPLPFLSWSSILTDRYPAGRVTITVTAHARSPER